MFFARLRAALAFACMILLGGCAGAPPSSPQAAAADDETFCQTNGGPAGSNGYAACMKERDLARESEQRRIDRAHQRMVDDMLNRR